MLAPERDQVDLEPGRIGRIALHHLVGDEGGSASLQQRRDPR
jgi:hypothetical protein